MRVTSVVAPFCVGALLVLSGCSSGADAILGSAKTPSHINNKVKFSAKTMGIKASPRVTTSRKVPKGGGRRYLGKRYKINGQWFTPKDDPNYDRKGQASWYGPNFHGRLTANGEVYDQFALSAAHPTLPMPSYARVTNLKNGHSVIVRINDRGPFHHKRIIDLSARGAELLDFQKQGIADVRVQYIGPAPLHGLDAKYLQASYKRVAPGTAPRLVAGASNGPKRGSSIRPSSGLGNGELLDTMRTGSVSKSKDWKAKANKSAPDPFLAELQRLRREGDNGSTLAKRLKPK
ncbi:MAG: septal ring lytic transglycosylase RlpA family protein [Pseudomonadota bacterium]